MCPALNRAVTWYPGLTVYAQFTVALLPARSVAETVIKCDPDCDVSGVALTLVCVDPLSESETAAVRVAA